MHVCASLHAFLFIRDTFIRDRKLSTGILGKNKRYSVLNILDVRDEPDNRTVSSVKNDSVLMKPNRVGQVTEKIRDK